jgi:hypothetical protein
LRRTPKLSDRRGQRASAEADDVVKPVTHKTETQSAGSLQRPVQVSRYAADHFHLFSNLVVAWRAAPPAAITMANILSKLFSTAAHFNALALIRDLDSRT